MSTKSHYVDNTVFTERMAEWTDRCRALKEQGLPGEQMSEYIASCVLQICENIAKKPSFARYTYKDEMIGDAIENCIKYSCNFNGARFNNAFAYVSQIAYTAIIRRIKKEKLLTIKHIKFIKNVVDVDMLSSAVQDASEQEKTHYEEYLSSLKLIIDDVYDDEPVAKRTSATLSTENSVLLDIMEENGEDL